jgi:large subunit ribosomal protein L9
MKLILTHEVSGLGTAGDIVEVKDGYGRNFLLPRGFAISWTRGGEKQVVQIKRARKVREVRDRDHANEIKQTLESMVIVVPAKAGATGKLFGSITTADIAAAVKSAGNISIDKRKVHLSGAVKTVGKHKATIDVHPGVSANVAFVVSAD